MTKRPIGIAGAGRIGQSLGRLLYQAGLPVVAVASRTPQHAAAASEFIGAGVRPVGYPELPGLCSRLIIAVPDDALANVACLLHQSGWEDGVVIHTSGVNGTEVLDCLAAEGSSVAALHPLQTVPSPETGQTVLVGCQYVLSGDGEAADWAKEIVGVLRGRLLELPNEARRLYHAAAVLICNDLIVVLEAGLRLLEKGGVEREAATKAFRSLAEQSVNNVMNMKRAEALTGPVSRGDVGTIKAHLDALTERRDGDLAQVERIYRVLGLYAVRLAEEQGLSETKARTLTSLLETGCLSER